MAEGFIHGTSGLKALLPIFGPLAEKAGIDLSVLMGKKETDSNSRDEVRKEKDK